MTLTQLKSKAGNLPAFAIAETVNEVLAHHQTLVITAPPGAGKSTLLPLTVWDGLKTKGKVLMLEPRRLAARQIAERMAHLVGDEIGQTVGYQVRFDRRISAQTQVEVLTEGILTRRIVSDATLDGVGVVVFDEFHERSLQTDLALALIRQVQQILRPDLKIIIMSATIDVGPIAEVLHAPVVQSEGRMYPVEVEYATQDANRQDVAQVVARVVAKAHRRHEGDILAFLPGQADIQRCQELLSDSLAPTEVLPLYGNLSPERQRKAIAPSPEGKRKVVLATPVAETSVTIEGVRIVVDSGWCRALCYEPTTGLSRLETVRISCDMATQRAGRAGRVAPGTCYRLWTRATEHRMAEQRTPEMMTADLTPMLLDVIAFGESRVDGLPWLTPPPEENVRKARQLLHVLGALNDEELITPLGRKMAAMPCHPRMAGMILSAETEEEKSLACDVAAVLEEKIPEVDDMGTDLPRCVARLRTLRGERRLGRWTRIAQIAAEYRRMVQVKEDNSDPVPEDVGRLIAYAYPERIAQAQDAIGHYRLAGGAMVRLDRTDHQMAYPWLAIASLHEAKPYGQVFLAAPCDPQALDVRIVSERDNLSWNSREGCVVMQREQRIGRLIVSSRPLRSASAEEVIQVLCEAVKKEGRSMLDWNESVERLQRRVAQVAVWHPELSVPDLTTDTLLASASDWLPLYLAQGDHVCTTVAELKKINLTEALWALVPYDLQQQIDRLAPTHVQVPTGSRIRIDYRIGAEAPVLSVRLQECFGMEDTPRVDDGRQPLLMELLSPGFKPVQLTQDLRSFWQNTYFEVRKELRRRYPKHSWPDNPLESEAVRGVARRK